MPKHPYQKTSQSLEFPAAKIVRRDPATSAIISKLTHGRNQAPRDGDGNRLSTMVNPYMFRGALLKRAKRNADAQMILRLLPDVELCIQILVSCILSPKDMTSVDLIYQCPEKLVKPNLASALIGRVEEYFHKSFPVKPILTEMLRESLCTKGSYPIAVLPENAIDYFINHDRALSAESLMPIMNHFDNQRQLKNIGTLGSPLEQATRIKTSKLAMESDFSRAHAATIDARLTYQDNEDKYKLSGVEEFVRIVDNPMILSLEKLNEKTRSAAIEKHMASAISPALEEIHKQINDHRIEQLIYRNRAHRSQHIAEIMPQHSLGRRSIGGPLILKLPSESVIPVHVPGNVKQHVGYFIMLDEEGNPIEAPDGDQYHQGLGAMGNGQNSSLASNLMRRVENNLNLGANTFDPMAQHHMDTASRLYGEIVERDLINRVKNGIYSSNVTLAKNEDLYRIMLARVLSKKYTQMLYIPAEYLSYIAFRYGDDGVGRSLMDEQSMINTLRTVILFTDIIAAMKNSIGRTKVSAQLDPNDPNVHKTIERAVHEVVRSRSLQLPLSASSPADIMRLIQQAGYEWEFTGHKGIPDMKFEFLQMNSNYAKSDPELRENLEKFSAMGFGLTPELVSNGLSDVEFATVAMQNNILLTKRVQMHQDDFVPQLSDLHRKIARNDAGLMDDLREIIENNKEDIVLKIEDMPEYDGVKMEGDVADKVLVYRVLTQFINGFSVLLPKPNSVTLESQLQELNSYSDLITKGLDAYIADSFFTTSTGGELANEVNSMRGMVHSYLMRQHMAKRGILPEMLELTAVTEDDKPQVDFFKMTTEHIAALIKSGVNALTTLSPITKAANKDLEAAGTDTSGSGGELDVSGGGGGDSGGDFGDDFGGGFDDVDMDLDMSGDPTGDDTGSQTTEQSETSESTQTNEDGTTTTKSSSSSSSSSQLN